MALGSGSLMKAQTPLQQLLEDINFQRTKEMRQLLKDDSGFVVLQGTTYWTDLFVRHFLFQSEPVHSIDSDDLLFFVRKKHVKGSSRHMPKYETEVDVYRKDSRKLPIGDPDVDWEETVYLNMVIHQFDYTLTLAICTRTSPKELQVLRRHSQRVYASPSRRKMDTKGDGEEMTYPHICFMVDNFDEVFSDILVRDGEMVCVELVASDKDGSVQGVIFLGSIRYDALKKVYDARQSSLSSKVAQRMTFGLFSSGAGVQTRCEFVRMKGPQGKGHAEMAVTKPKGSGVETPTSEPGFCATDMWEYWDEDPDDYYNYRHQRRLSDPSANLNNFSRHGWRAKNATESTAASKARSENEGLDSIANEVSEIEAGDLRDDRPASSAMQTTEPPTTLSTLKNPTNTMSLASVTEDASTINVAIEGITSPTTNCCNCFNAKKCKRWSDQDSAQMSDMYCRTCDEAAALEEANATPACLNDMPNKMDKPKHKNVLNIESELVVTGSSSKLSSSPEKKNLSNRSKPTSPCKKDKKSFSPKKVNVKEKSNEKKIPGKAIRKISNSSSISSDTSSQNGKNNNEKVHQEYEIGDDAASLYEETSSMEKIPPKIGILSANDKKIMISVHGKEEMPVEATAQLSEEEIMIDDRKDVVHHFEKCTLTQIQHHPLELENTSPNNQNEYSDEIDEGDDEKPTEKTPMLDDLNGNVGATNGKSCDRKMSTLPRVKKPSVYQNMCEKALRIVPKRTTPDGTNIYYWCDLPKKALKELDDGAYNPLWASRGFTQTFHFWKENRRQQSTPLNAFLTYVTLPWWSIAKDLLDHRETPILTF